MNLLHNTTRRAFLGILGCFGAGVYVAKPVKAKPAVLLDLDGYKLPSEMKPPGYFIRWGTWGKKLQYYKPGGEPKWVLLGECSDDHLRAILATQYQVSEELRGYIRGILEWRKERNITVSETKILK